MLCFEPSFLRKQGLCSHAVSVCFCSPLLTLITCLDQIWHWRPQSSVLQDFLYLADREEKGVCCSLCLPLGKSFIMWFFWDRIQRGRDLVRQVSRKPGCVTSSAPGTTCLVYNLHRKYPAWQIPCRQCPKIPFWSWTFQFSKVTDLFRDQREYSVSLWSLKNIWLFSVNYLSIFVMSLPSWGKKSLGCTGGPPLPRSPLPTQTRPSRSCRLCLSADSVDGGGPVMVPICIHLLVCIQHKLEENETLRIQ